MQGTTKATLLLFHNPGPPIFAPILMAAVIFPLLLCNSRAADLPQAILERAAQIPGADLSAVQLVDASTLPIGGAFWSAQRTHYPPAPCNWLAAWTDDVQIYWLGAGTRYLVDDRDIDYETLNGLQSAGMFTMSDSSGDDSGEGGTPLYATNDLWIELISTALINSTNMSATLLVHTPEVLGVYDLFFKQSLLPGNAWYWVARGLPGQTNFYLVNLPSDGGFFILGTANFTDTNGLTAAYLGLIGGADTLTNDFDHDGLSDAWEINYFGDLSQSPFGDYDADGVNNFGSYTNATDGDPNKIQFFLNLPAERVNSNAVFASPNIRSGNPSYIAILVNNTNRSTATWQLFNSTNIPLSLSSGDGKYGIQIGLRGRAVGALETWVRAQLTLDTVPPVVAITNPTSTITSWPLIQLQGWANEPLGRISFDITNSTGWQTNLTGYVIGQVSDTNLLDFTTNYYQCYDVALVEGTNRVTLHLTDLAGNATTTNLTVLLDYSTETNSPALGILWPSNGAQLAGDSFTVQAQVDNPTVTVQASIVDNAGNTNTVQGIIERDGSVWAKNLPLAAGTNLLVVTATTAAGHTTTTSAALIRSSVSVILDPLSTNQLNKSLVNLTGSVSDPTANVWINGIQARVDGSGNLTANNVPTSPNGTGIFDIEVYNSDSGPTNGTPIGSLQIDQPQPARVVLMNYSGYQGVVWSIVDPCYPLDNGGEYGDDIRWSYDQGGFYHRWSGGDRQQQNPPFDIINPLSSGQESIAPPWEFASVSDGLVGPTACGVDSTSEARRTETRVMLEPEGQSAIGGSTVYLVRAKALAFAPPTVNDTLHSHGDLITGSYSNYAGTIPLSADKLQIDGANLINTGETNDDGSTWGATLVQAPAGVRPDVTPAATQTQGFKDYTFDVKAEEIKLSITANGITLDPNKVVTNANFIVGQVLTFSTNWSKLPPGVASRKVQWTFEGNFLNESNQLCANCSPNYATNQAKLTNETTSAWWVSGANPAATYSAQLIETLTLSNGSTVVVSGKGLFSLLKPQARMDAITGTLALDTHMYDGLNNNGIPQYTFGLHYGVPTLSDTNSVYGPPGIVISNYVSLPAGFSGSAQFVQVINSYLLRYQSTNGSWIRAAGAGLDGSSPYPTMTSSNRMEDSPASNINEPPCQSQRMSMSNSFVTFLEFKPTVIGEAHWVPLRKVPWTVAGEGILVGTNCLPSDWVGTNFMTTPNPADMPTEDYATWTNKVVPPLQFLPE